MTIAFEESVEIFDFLESWQDRYRHIIDMGKSMHALDPALRLPPLKVEGCASQVWFLPKIKGRIFSFDGASDSLIVNGLIAILRQLYNGLSLQQILEIDAEAAFMRIGLHQHLSAQRSNGLRAMVAKIHQFALTNLEK